MGTISEKLTYLNGTKQLLKDKINNLGGSIDEQTTFRQYVNQLDGVYDVLPKTSFQEGTSVTIENGLKGKIDFDDGKVGFGQASQESTQGYNLLLNELQSQSINGLTIVRNADGSIKINGTATADTNLFFIQNGANNLPAGTYTIALIGKTTQLGMYFYKGTGTENRVAYIPISDTTGKTQFTINEATLMLNIYLYIPTGNTFNNVTLYPMIYSGTTDKDYEKYSGGYASPSPNWEQPIQCVTGNQEIVESGKNLFEPVISIDGTQIVGNNMPNLGVTDGEFSFTANGADAYFGQVSASGSTYTANRGIKIYRNGNEKISYKISNTEINRNFITAYDSNGTSLGYVEKSGSSQGTYVFPTNCDFVTFRIGKENAVSGTIYKFNVMVAYGDTIPDYEPYHTPITYPISLGSNKFYKIGDYADELLYDVENDKVYKNEKIGKVVYTGASGESWTSQQYGTNSYSIGISDIMRSTDDATPMLCLSNLFRGVPLGERTTAGDNIIYSDGASNGIYIRNTTYTSVSDFKTMLSTNNLKVCYVKATPILTELTDTTLHQQVKNWYYSQSFNGTTIIESNGDLPMIIKVRALKGE